MFETVVEAIEILHEDKTVSDVLNTVSATVSSLVVAHFTMEEAIAISVVLMEAEKRIKEIIPSEQ